MRNYIDRKHKFKADIREKEDNLLYSFMEILFVVMFALMLAVVFRTQVSIPRSISGYSMLPTYNVGAPNADIEYDTVRITKIGKIRHGDVVIAVSEGLHKDIIKRVIGIGGDWLEFRMGEAGYIEIYRNDVKLTEDYINKDANGKPMFTKKGDYNFNEKFQVKEGCYFLMGDNRDNSSDSRLNSVGHVPASNIEGKVYLNVPYGDNYIRCLWKKVFNW